jgi:hypothetical protein
MTKIPQNAYLIFFSFLRAKTYFNYSLIREKTKKLLLNNSSFFTLRQRNIFNVLIFVKIQKQYWSIILVFVDFEGKNIILLSKKQKITQISWNNLLMINKSLEKIKLPSDTIFSLQ